MNHREVTRRSRLRALTAAALRYDGLTLQEIAVSMGVTHRETARMAVYKGEMILRRDYAALNECAELIARGAQPQSCDAPHNHK